MGANFKLYLREIGDLARNSGSLSVESEEEMRLNHTLLKINYTLRHEIEAKFNNDKIQDLAKGLFGFKKEYDIVQKALTLQVNKWQEKRIEFLNDVKELVCEKDGHPDPRIKEKDLQYLTLSMFKKKTLDELTNIELITLKNIIPQRSKEVEIMEKRLSIRGEDVVKFNNLPLENKIDLYKNWMNRQRKIGMGM